VYGAASEDGSWLERLRRGLVAFLGFFDDESQWARLLLAGAPPSDGALALRREQHLLGVLTCLLDDGSPLVLGELMSEPQLASELVAGGVVAVLRKRMLAGGDRPLVELAPSLMAFVVAPYMGRAVAEAELVGISPAGGRERVSGEARVRPGFPGSGRSRSGAVTPGGVRSHPTAGSRSGGAWSGRSPISESQRSDGE
jgi:hypothetical protein